MFNTIFNLLMHIPFELRMALIMAIGFAIFALFVYVTHIITMPKGNKKVNKSIATKGKEMKENVRYQHR